MKLRSQSVPSRWLRVFIPAVLIAVWFGLAGVGGPYFGRIEEVSSTDLTTFLPESSQATRVNEQLSKYQDSDQIPAVAVFERKRGEISSTELQAITDATKKLESVEGVSGDVSPPVVSENKQAALVIIPLKSDGEFEKIFTSIDDSLDKSRLSIPHLLTGPASFARDLNQAFAGIDGLLLLVALAVVFVILLIVYRSPLLPFIVLMTAMTALTVSILLVWNLANADIVQLNGQVQGILFILVIGAATDYSLLYVARYREELKRYHTPWEATVAAWKASFEPIVASGGTVIVGLLCLLFSDLGSNRALGPVGSIGIIFSILSALTLLPAVLLLIGRSVFWPRKPLFEPRHDDHDESSSHAIWRTMARIVQKRPRLLWVGISALLLIATFNVINLRAGGVSQTNLILGYSESREGQAALSRHFPDGSGTPTYVIAKNSSVDQLVTLLESDKGVESVTITADNSPSGTKPLGRSATELEQDILTEVTAQLEQQKAELRATLVTQMQGAPATAVDAAFERAVAAFPSAESVADGANPFKDASPKIVDGTVLMQVTLRDAADSSTAKDTIKRIRAQVGTIDSGILVGGTTAAQLDTNEASLRDRQVIIPMILIAITIILMVLLRSIVAPLILLVTTVISFGATLGIAAFMFNEVWGFQGADPSVILFGFVFLVALGIDYNIFLMTRVREEALIGGTRKGVIKGLVVTGGVITSAGIVLAATFAALAVIPILFLAQIAFIVAFGVLLDTIIVRSLLVPAIIVDAGSRVWWPSKLTKKP